MNTRGALGESAPQRPGGRAPRGLSAPPGPPEASGPSVPAPARGALPRPRPPRGPSRRGLPSISRTPGSCSSKQLSLFVLADFPYLLAHFREAHNSVFQPFCRSLFKSTRSIGPLPFCPLRPTRLPSRPPAPLFQAAIRFKSIFSKGEKLITVPGPRQPQCGGHVAGQARPGRRAAGSAPSGPGRVLTQAGRGSSGLRERGRRLRDHSGTVGQAGGAGLWRRLSSRQGADGGVVGGLCFYSPPLCFKLS